MVRDKTHEAMELRALIAESRLRVFTSTYNKLIDRINDLGGEEFMQDAKIGNAQSDFSQKDIDSLIRLCHEVNGSKLSFEVRITEVMRKRDRGIVTNSYFQYNITRAYHHLDSQ